MAVEQITQKGVQKAQKKAVDAVKKFVKSIIKMLGWQLPEWIPGIGFLWPGNIILVWKTLGGVSGNLVGPEGLLMLPIAIFAYATTLIIGIIEIWFDLGIFTTLITWAIAGFFATWKYVMHGGESEKTEDKRPDEKPGDSENANNLNPKKDDTGKTPSARGISKPSTPSVKK